MQFALIGGDRRTITLARRLLQDGHELKCFALDTAEIPTVCKQRRLQEALAGAQYVILPTPLLKGGKLNAPFSAVELDLETLVLALPESAGVFAGGVPEKLRRLFRAQHLRLIDLLDNEALAVTNAELTAQCALELLLSAIPYRLQTCRVLLLGAGRIGRLLGLKLRNMGAEVTCAARSPVQRAWCSALGLRPVPLTGLAGILWQTDILINTIPAPILDSGELQLLPEGALVLDLASAPGGFRPEDLDLLQLDILPGGGLPGKYAPEAAGNALADAIYEQLGGTIHEA